MLIPIGIALIPFAILGLMNLYAMGVHKGDRTMQAQPTTNDAIGLDPELRAFLRTVLSCQCLALAAWAAKILRAGWIDEAGLARCFNLGFDA